MWSPEDKAEYPEESRTIGGSLQDGDVLFPDLQKMYKEAKVIN